MPVPLYARHPALYCYNTESKKHMLRSGRAYKKALAANPGIFVESTSILESDDVVPIATPTPIVPEPVSPKPVSLEPVSRPPSEDLKSIEKQRQLITQLIKQELAQNPKPYEGKQTQDLDVLFRQLLVAKLLKSNESNTPTINKLTKAVKPPTKKAPLKFKVVQPQVVDDEDDFTDEEEEQ